jgi:hypothetical protein
MCNHSKIQRLLTLALDLCHLFGRQFQFQVFSSIFSFLIEQHHYGTMDRWSGLDDPFLDEYSFVSSKQSGNRSSTFDMLSLQGSLVEERSIEERSNLWNGNSSFADPDGLCHSARGIPGAEAAKELLWEVQASCLRAKGEAQEMIEEQYRGAVDRWSGLYKSFFGESSFVSSKQSGNLSTTSDMLIIRGSLVEERSIEERSIVKSGNNSFTDPDDLCHSERGIPGAEAAKELLWEVHASCLRAKGEAEETIAEFFSDEEKEKRAAQQLKSVEEFKEVGKAYKAAIMACGDHADAFLAFLLSERMDIHVRNDLDITETLTQDYAVTESDGTVTMHSVKHVLQWKDDDDATVEVFPSQCDDVYLIPMENNNGLGQGENAAEEDRDDPETNDTTQFIDDLTSFDSANDRTPAYFPAFASESEESGLDFKQPLSDTLSQDERNIAPFADRGRMVGGNNTSKRGQIENIALRRAAPMSRDTGSVEESVATQPKSNRSAGYRRRLSARRVSKSEANDDFDFSSDQIGVLAMAAIAKARLPKASISISDPSKSVIDPYRSHNSRTGGRNYGVITNENPIQHINLVDSHEPIDLTMYDDSNE